MTPDTSQLLLRRYTLVLKRAWLRAVRAVDRDRSVSVVEAERFADVVIASAITAGYGEAKHLRTGAFDPTISAERFRVERGWLVSRFLNDVRRSPSALSVGLSARQLRDLRIFASTLETASLDAIDFGAQTVFTTRESQVQVNRVQRAMVNQRSAVVGRTEALTALGLGIDVAIEQTEALTGQPVKRTWKTAADEKVRSSHGSMNGQSRPKGQPFISGKGNALRSPGDLLAPADERVNCRCYLVTEN